MNHPPGTAKWAAAVMALAFALRVLPSHGDEPRELPAESGKAVTNWLFLGDFPSPLKPAGTLQNEIVGEGFDRDFLKEAGGEFGVRPREGAPFNLPDGTEIRWTPWRAPNGILSADGAAGGHFQRETVFYFFTTVEGAAENKSYIDVAGRGNARIFLNGYQIFRHRMRKGREDYRASLPVCLRKGGNSLLCKADAPAGAWKMSLRLVDGRVADADLPYPEPVVTQRSPTDTSLAVLTDARKRSAAANLPSIRVESVMPGGKVIERRESGWGKTVVLETRAWKAGPYEIRLSWPLKQGGRGFTYLRWFKGDWRAAEQQLIAESAALNRDSDAPRDLAMRLLGTLMQDRLGKDYTASVHAILMERGDGKAGYLSNATGNGFVRLAWRDDVDGSPQYARVYFPPDYDNRDMNRKWPMVVNLHGSDFSYPEYIHWWGVDQRHHWLADRYGVIVLEPHGRGMTSFEGIGEKDVLGAIAKAKADFRVDEDRVYLMGCSMGGHGTYNVGTRHPGLFAALASVCGGGGFFHVFMDPKQIEAMSPRERFRAEGRGAWAQVDALLNVPIMIAHGDKDDAVTVEYSRFIVKLLQDWGYDVRYWEHPGKKHGDLGAFDDIVRWFLGQRREKYPVRVKVRSARLDSAKAYWVRVLQRDAPYSFITADVRAVEKGRIVVDSGNAVELELAPPREFLRDDGAASVVWNGKDCGWLKGSGGRIVLRAESYRRGPLSKTPGIEGPLGDVANTPHAIVVGTISGDERMRLFCKRRAEIMRKGWLSWQRVEPRCLQDTEVTDEILGRYSLRLVGGPAENAVARKLADRIPLELKPGRIVIDGCEFACSNGAVALVYPNPANPERYVSITAGNSPEGMYLCDYLWDGEDFVIEDERGYVASGRFDADWRLGEAFVERADPAKRAGVAALRGVPRYTAAPADRASFALSELLEIQTSDVFRRNTNQAGEPLAPGGGRSFDSGFSVGIWQSPHTVTFDISSGAWARLKGTLGIELARYARPPDEAATQATAAGFAVVGDGKTIYESPLFHWDSPPAEIDVDIRGVRSLELRTAVPRKWLNQISSLDWADIRLEK